MNKGPNYQELVTHIRPTWKQKSVAAEQPCEDVALGRLANDIAEHDGNLSMPFEAVSVHNQDWVENAVERAVRRVMLYQHGDLPKQVLIQLKPRNDEIVYENVVSVTNNLEVRFTMACRPFVKGGFTFVVYDVEEVK